MGCIAAATPAHAFMKLSGLKLTISENAESIHRPIPGEARRSADHLLTGQRNEGGNPHPPGPRRTRRVANPNRPSSAHSRPCNRSSSCGTRHVWRIMGPAFRAAAPLIHQRTKLPGRGGEAGPPARWSSRRGGYAAAHENIQRKLLARSRGILHRLVSLGSRPTRQGSRPAQVFYWARVARSHQRWRRLNAACDTNEHINDALRHSSHRFGLVGFLAIQT